MPIPADGVHHALLWHERMGDRQRLLYVDENRQAFAHLAVLYTWIHCDDDHQLIYEVDPPHRVMSVDHSCFLPEGPDWGCTSLRERKGDIQRQPFFDPAQLTHAEWLPPIAALRGIDERDIAGLAANALKEWGITAEEKIALADFLAYRRAMILQMYDDGNLP